jgi:5-methylcytosine-specific restriction endonuclease McrA
MARVVVCEGKDADGRRCVNPTSDPSRRCPDHQGFGSRFRPATRRPKVYDTRAYRRKRQRLIDAWVERHGWVCPGWRIPSHPTRSFALDHVEPLVAGGSAMDDANLQPLCGPCNSRKSLHDRQVRR